jgi:hypothetical protein
MVGKSFLQYIEEEKRHMGEHPVEDAKWQTEV